MLEDILAARSATLLQGQVTPRELGGWSRYREIDRGSYDVSDVIVPDLVAKATALVTGELVHARLIRLHPGDYLLAHADEPRERGTEVVFDLSPGVRPDGELQYRQHGQVFFRMPCAPGSAAVVPRTLSVSCNHQYLSKLHTGDIVRWIGWFVAR